MNRLLLGVTHALVSVPTREESKRTSTFALVDLCFGPGDDTAISGLRYVRNQDGQMAWQGPMFTYIANGHDCLQPVLKGTLLVDVVTLASQALNRIKKDLGAPAWGTQYRILKDQTLIESKG